MDGNEDGSWNSQRAKNSLCVWWCPLRAGGAAGGQQRSDRVQLERAWHKDTAGSNPAEKVKNFMLTRWLGLGGKGDKEQGELLIL